MSDPAPRFTIEVLGFPGGSDVDAIAGSLADFFGISHEEGKRLVRKAPVRVKRNAPPDVTQQLVRQLRKLGADVLVRNEETGEERAYGAERDATRPPASEDASPLEASPQEDTLESDEPSPAPPPRRGEVVVLVQGDEKADAPPVSAPVSQPPVSVPVPPPPRMPFSSQPSEPRVRLSSQPGDAPISQPGEPPRSSDRGAPRGPVAISVPPPSQQLSVPPPSSSQQQLSVPPPSRAPIQFCASCKSPVEKGEICSRCGWSNVEKQRHCRQCKKKLALVSNISKSVVLMAAIGAASIAMAAGALVVFGALVAVAAFLFGIFLGFAGDAATLRYACKSCTIGVVRERLLKEEQVRLSAARRKSVAIAIGCGAAAVAFWALPGGADRTLSASSFTMGWSVRVPSSNSRIGGDVATLQLPSGTRRARVQWAERAFFPGKTFFLATLQYTFPSGSGEPDKAGLQASIKQLVEVVFNGSLKGAPAADGESFQAEFTGAFHGKSLSGRIRGTQYEHDIVIVVVTASDASALRDSDVDAYLTSVAVDKATK